MSNQSARKALLEEFWRCIHTQGSPILQSQDDGKYKVTFLFQSNAENQVIKLDCPDLYDRLMDDNEDDRQKRFSQIPGTDIYTLTIDDVPADIFAVYNIKIDKSSQTDINNKHPVQLLEHNVSGNQTVIHSSSCLIMPQAVVPEWLSQVPSSQATGSSITHSTVDKADSDNFSERDVWIYKPDGYDQLNNKKVLFMLDGEHFCKMLTPYLDAMQHDDRYKHSLSNTAIVFINPGKYSHAFPPGRIYEYFIMKDQFSNFLADRIIPQYCNELGVQGRDNILLAGHSLCAFNFIYTAFNHPDRVGGVLMFSAALNLQNGVQIPTASDQHTNLPIYMQIGQLEDPVASPQIQQEWHLTNQSRLDANRDFHQQLTQAGYPSHLHEFASGHNELHVISGLIYQSGMSFRC